MSDLLAIGEAAGRTQPGRGRRALRAGLWRRHLERDDRRGAARRGRRLFHRDRRRPLRAGADRTVAEGGRRREPRRGQRRRPYRALFRHPWRRTGTSSPICGRARRRAGSARADLPVDRIKATQILHVSGISQAISSSAADAVFAAIDVAREAKRLVSYDPNLRLKLWPLRRARAVIHEAMRSSDIALPGLDDAHELCRPRPTRTQSPTSISGSARGWSW